MGGDAAAAAAAPGRGGRVKSLGLEFQDEGKGGYASGETVAGRVLLEAAEPVALRALRLEARGRATAGWGPSAGSAEAEYLNVRLNLREAPAGERGRGPGRGPGGGGGGGGGSGGGAPRRSRAGNNARAPRAQPPPHPAAAGARAALGGSRLSWEPGRAVRSRRASGARGWSLRAPGGRAEGGGRPRSV